MTHLLGKCSSLDPPVRHGQHIARACNVPSPPQRVIPTVRKLSIAEIEQVPISFEIPWFNNIVGSQLTLSDKLSNMAVNTPKFCLRKQITKFVCCKSFPSFGLLLFTFFIVSNIILVNDIKCSTEIEAQPDKFNLSSSNNHNFSIETAQEKQNKFNDVKEK